MRATTRWTLNVSRATRAAMMLELSPLLTAAKAPGLLDAGLDEGLAVEADALDLAAAEVLAEAAERQRVLVDHRDGVLLQRRQLMRERGPDTSAPHDHDVHRACLSFCLPGRLGAGPANRTLHNRVPIEASNGPAAPGTAVLCRAWPD